jgi:hypothetical protein
VRATVVDSLQRSFRTIVPIECVADKHESPHFANLYDMMLKYADVLTISKHWTSSAKCRAKDLQHDKRCSKRLQPSAIQGFTTTCPTTTDPSSSGPMARAWHFGWRPM